MHLRMHASELHTEGLHVLFCITCTVIYKLSWVVISTRS